MLELSVIIVSYNVKFFLEQALRSIQKSLQSIRSEIIVVDNGSGDGSVRLVRERFPEVRLIANQENKGFARANNQAIALAGGDAIVLINPDTLVREDTFRQCLDYLWAHPDVGALGCKILSPDGTLQLSCRRSFPTPWVAFSKVTGLSALFPRSRIFGRYNLTYLDPDAISEVEALSGSFMMVRKKAADEVGPLDERFFMYGEDLDWCYRIRQKGWKIVYLPSTEIIHYKGRSAREASFDHVHMFYGAMRLFVQKHFKNRRFFLPQWVLLLGIGVRGALSFVRRIANRLIIPFIDLVFLQAAMALAIVLRFGDLRPWKVYGIVAVVYSLVWLGCLFALGLYRRGVYSSSKAAGAVVAGLVFNASLTFFFPQYAFSRQVVLVAGMLNILFLGGWRLLIRFASRIRAIPFLGTVGRTLLKRRLLIVGTGEAASGILRKIRQRVDSGYEPVGFLVTKEEDLLKESDTGVPVLGTLQELDRIARSHRIRTVVFSPDEASYRAILAVIASTTHLHLDYKMVPRDLDAIIGKTSIDSLEDIPLLDLEYRIYSGPNRVFKRFFDLAISVPSAFLSLLAFVCVKFHRACTVHPVFIFDGSGKKIPVPRITFRGREARFLTVLIRMIDVVRGRLSLVGAEMIPYGEGVHEPWYKPGLTGLVQINQKRALSPDDRERYHLFYLRNYTPLLDLEILWKSLFR